MIIFGTRGVTTTRGTGNFNCPTCRTSRGYRHREVRRFFTLYFIPVIPLDNLGEYIECQSCGDTYKTEVLSYQPQKTQEDVYAEYSKGVKLALIEMVLADGSVEDSEIETMQAVYQEITGIEIGAQEIRADIDRATKIPTYAIRELAKLEGVLNDNGKEKIIKAAHKIALADGDFHEEERHLLERIGKALGMTNSQVRGIIETANAA